MECMEIWDGLRKVGMRDGSVSDREGLRIRPANGAIGLAFLTWISGFLQECNNWKNVCNWKKS
jgi:hypothetical protein